MSRSDGWSDVKEWIIRSRMEVVFTSMGSKRDPKIYYYKALPYTGFVQSVDKFLGTQTDEIFYVHEGYMQFYAPIKDYEKESAKRSKLGMVIHE